MSDQGVDVSRWQPPINWGQVRASGRTFAVIKASGGDGAPAYAGVYSDPAYQGHHQGARAAGLLTGAYHFLGMGDGAAQARQFIAATGGYANHELPPTVDYESCDASGAVKPTAAILHAFIDELARLLPRRWTGPKGTPVPCMIYTGAAMAGRFRGDEDQFDLWHAAYVPPGARTQYVPSPWRQTAVWQYSGTGQVPGVRGSCDLNVTIDPGWLTRVTGNQPPPEEDDMPSADEVADAVVKKLGDDSPESSKACDAIARKVWYWAGGGPHSAHAEQQPDAREVAPWTLQEIGHAVAGHGPVEPAPDDPTMLDKVDRLCNATPNVKR